MIVQTHSFCYMVAFLIMLTAASCTTLPDEEWDKFVTAMHQKPASAASSSAFGSQLPRNLALQPLGTQNHRLDPLLQYDVPQLATTSNEATASSAHHDFLGNPEALQEQSVIPIGNGVRELSMVERTQSLARVHNHLRLAARSKGWINAPVFRPATTVPKEKLEAFARHLIQLPRRLGPWPYQVDAERFLLHQIGPKTTNSDEINGFKYADHGRAATFFGVWKELGPPGSRIFQYMGVFQGPHQQLMQVYKNHVLSHKVMPLEKLEMLSDSTFAATFQDRIGIL